MRRDLVLAALLLPLGGCYVPPQGPDYGYAQPGYPSGTGYGYAQPGYAQPGYPPPGYPQPGYPPPGYPPAAYDPSGAVYPGYSYNDGAPTLLVDGAVMPLIVVGGGWGYYDTHHDWHRAPDGVSQQLERQRASGASFRPSGEGYPQSRPPGGTEPYRGQSPYRPADQGRPAATSYAAPRPPPAAQPAHEERERSGQCPPGQRC